MVRNSAGRYLVYALMLTLVGSIFSMSVSLQPSIASHSDIELVEVSDTNPDPGDEITISGRIDGADEDEEVEITVSERGGGSAGDADTEVDDDEEFSESFEVPDSADDGIYEIEVEFGNEDSTFAYFLIDEEDNDVEVVTEEDSYEPGQDVEISGEVTNPVLGENDVEIIVLDHEGNDIGPGTVDIDNNNEFEETLELDNDAHAGTYAIIVEYDGDEAGWFVFEVTEDSGSSSDDPITVELSKTSYKQGEEVVISGTVEEVEVGEEVFITVEDEDGEEVFSESDDPASNGDYEFSFDLEDDSPTGIYTVLAEYMSDEAEETFSVTSSTSSGGGGSGSGSGSDSGLTARLSKTSLLAGETLTVSGVVPRIETEEDGVSITITTPEGHFVATRFPEPSSAKSYTASFVLPSTLAEDDDYRVVVFYDDNEVELSFDITGRATGSTGVFTVKTDRTTYAVGSTVTISGQISDEVFVEGRQIALQVFNPDDAPYRFDPIEPEDDGSYSYPMQVGGPLGVTGTWEVKVTYGDQSSETTFDLTGGVASTPKYTLRVDDDTFTIEYQSDGPVNSMYVRPAEKKLVVSIDGEEEGQLTITLPREVIDAVQSGSDIQYVVSTLDTQTGEERLIDITEGASNAAERTITIDYEAGTDLIEIQGTNIVPEFGPLSAIVLAAGVFSIIAVMAKFTSRFGGFRQW
jgi:hypothetical protein